MLAVVTPETYFLNTLWLYLNFARKLFNTLFNLELTLYPTNLALSSSKDYKTYNLVVGAHKKF